MTPAGWSVLALREVIAAGRAERRAVRPVGMPRRRWRRINNNPRRRSRRLRALPMWERFALERAP